MGSSKVLKFGSSKAEAGNVATEKEDARKTATASLPLGFNVAAGCRRRHGFSMIEVLVASTIMIVIMLMLGMMFQQTSQAWRTGRQRADALQKARTFFGILQRDVSAAIDVNSLPLAMRQAIESGESGLPGGIEQSFTSSELQFFTLTGAGFDDLNAERGKNNPLRSLTHVQYRTDGGRNETVLLPQANGGFRVGNSRFTNFFTSQVGEDLTGVRFQVFALDSNGNIVQNPPAKRFPAYVTVYAEVTAATNTWEIGARSWGPDRLPDTEDDIKTWTDTQ